ncbi:prephenate dehydrogenase/arogenate dehydrogenase family protein [Candidatus Parcubacteria bacterium]|nr:MAG: prephenate dehydrogenase/arogenate dehydrogenase family protein [Candidatus Parcubacteria bacterium]
MKNKKILIIGFCNFGKLATSILARNFDVSVLSRTVNNEVKRQIEKCGAKIADNNSVKQADVVVLCAPISKTEEIIKKIAPKMKADSLLFDTSSVKVLPCKWLKENTREDIEIVGTHPMFGPTTSKFDLEKQSWQLDGLQIVLCPLRTKEETLEKIRSFLNSLNLKIIETSPEDHDKQNAKTLSFVHYVGRSLLASNIGHQEIFTPGYIDLLSILPHTTSDNWQLFYDMNNYNPYSAPLREIFRDAGLKIEEKIIMNSNKEELEKQREMIDLIDMRIMKLLESRLEHTKQIGEYKKAKNIDIVDKKREDDIIKNKQEKTSLDDKFIKKLYRLILDESYKTQE